MSSSYRYTKSPTSFNQRIDIPIRRLSNNSNYKFNEQYIQNPIHSKDTTVQWINDPITGDDKYRIKINIEGFNQNEVHIRVDGNKLFVYGERIENKSQGTSKKIIEKFYELPPDINTFSPNVTFPSPITMQVDFSSKRYISPRKLNDNNAISTSHIHSPYDNPHRIPIQHVSSAVPTRSNSPIYKFRESNDDPLINKNGTIHKQTVTETHRETHHQRSSPTTGIQSSYEFEHQRSGSPTLSTNVNLNHRSITPISDNSDNESSFFSRDFNSDIFYRSEFQPEIFTNDHKQRYIEMKLNVYDYNPNEIKVSINDNDLIVYVEHTNFYKKITLPSNIDLSSLSLNYHHNKKLYITIKLLDEYSSFKYI